MHTTGRQGLKQKQQSAGHRALVASGLQKAAPYKYASSKNLPPQLLKYE
jgi:hypothetical protein